MTRIFVKCSSHRARERLQRLIGKRQCWFSFFRNTFHGVYEVSAEELERVRRVKGVSRLRAPYDDLHPCWS